MKVRKAANFHINTQWKWTFHSFEIKITFDYKRDYVMLIYIIKFGNLKLSLLIHLIEKHIFDSDPAFAIFTKKGKF